MNACGNPARPCSLITSDSLDVYYNLALEEWLLMHRERPLEHGGI